ncbi:MAG: hypothetical protein WBD99_15505 [Thermodesulfobacteriota bacterium]
MDINFMRLILYQFPIAIIVAIIVTTNYGCGSNPPFAPSGSSVTMLNPPGDILIPPDALEPIEVEAIVETEDGEPLNSVRVFWDLSFAGENSLVADTNGDGLPDSRALQLVDPTACPSDCQLEPISTWFFDGAFVDSPFQTLTDDRGISRVIILITNQNGTNIIDPATLEVSTRSGSVDVVEFSVNVP